MHEAAIAPLPAWQNFYTIVGTAAATLTGLMFVVISFIAQTQSRRSNRTTSTFGTPTVVHFCVALAIAATLSAPWQALWAAAVLIGLIGLGGVIYVALILWRVRHLEGDYQPVMEDWLWHVIFPLGAYIALLVASFMLTGNPLPALFTIGGVTLLLLFIGIHNSWDTVTYVTTINPQSQQKSQD